MDALAIVVIIIVYSPVFLGPVFFGWLALTAWANFGFDWAVPFIIAGVLIGCGRQLTRQMEDPRTRKKRQKYLVLSIICWLGFGICISHAAPHFYESKPTGAGASLVIPLMFLFCMGVLFWRFIFEESPPPLVPS